jgi:hypothetical protein
MDQEEGWDGLQRGSEGWDGSQREQDELTGEPIGEPIHKPICKPVDQYCSSCNQKKPLIDFGRFLTYNTCRQRNRKVKQAWHIKQKALLNNKSSSNLATIHEFSTILGHHFSHDSTCKYFLIVILIEFSIIPSTFPHYKSPYAKVLQDAIPQVSTIIN